jgi:regulator of sigma E protease
MNFDLLHIVMAMLGLSFLVFIHEMGHYLVAKHVGMRVEVFSIGFGKPIHTWMRNGVKWQVCYLLFGGYVKIAGMEKEKGIDPHQIKDGFYGKRPIDRIKVAIMGPLVNIVFAFLVFSMIWALGGREKRFQEFTNIIGWVEPGSQLLQNGVKPGDTITQYAGKKFNGFKDLIYGGIANSDSIDIQGNKVNYFTNQKEAYEYHLQSYPMPGYPKGVKTIGATPANFLVFSGFDSRLGQYSSAYNSGIREGDRVVWANGETVFSLLELNKIVNRGDAYLTIERKGSLLHVRVPRVSLNDLQINADQKDEFLDWKRALDITSVQEELFFIPYEVDVLGLVKGKFAYIDSDLPDETGSREYAIAGLDIPLMTGDQILAVNGRPVSNGLEIFKELRTNKVLVVVDRVAGIEKVSWLDANKKFADSVNWKDLKDLTDGIGSSSNVREKGQLVLLNPIEPISIEQIQVMQQNSKEGYVPQIASSLKQDKKLSKRMILGLGISDKRVVYNPSPVKIFEDVILETVHTISSLVTGSISPKWLSGPVGIVSVMQQGLGIGYKEALYWMGLISLNLGLVNLLPIPVLDGGHITFSLWEMITRRRISSKVLEKIVLPFVVLMIAFFIYVTFQDIIKLFMIG